MSGLIEKSGKDKIPEGTILISREKALEIQRSLVKKWEPKSDVWYIRFGPGILSATSVVSSTLIMQHYRRRLKLFTFGRPIMFIPGVIFPALAIPVIHQMDQLDRSQNLSLRKEPLTVHVCNTEMQIFEEAVLDSILLLDHCPVCIQMRGLMVQSMAAIAYPILVHSVGSFMLANSFATYRLPEFSLRKPGEIWSLWRKFSKRLFGNLPMHFLLQVGMSIFITEMQAKELFKVQANMSQQQSP